MLEAHNQHMESTVTQNAELIKKLTSKVDHLSRRVESLVNGVRIMSLDDMQNGGMVIKSSSTSPSNSPPVSVDNRPQAPLPIGAKRREPLAVPVCNGNSVGRSYGLIGGNMEGVSPPSSQPPSRCGSSPPVGIYSSAQDDVSTMSNAEYLSTLSHRQVGMAYGCGL